MRRGRSEPRRKTNPMRSLKLQLPLAAFATALAVLTLPGAVDGQTVCPPDAVVQPGRWLAESVRDGEASARGRAEILRLDGGCILVERLVLHSEDGSSHHVAFVQGSDRPAEAGTLVQIGDHPLFLVWQREAPGRFRTIRQTDGGSIELRWIARPRGDGFQRELFVRRDGQSDWTSSEVITYEPLGPVDELANLPSLTPGPFHDPDACDAPEFREMDYLYGHWFNEEWVREGERWVPGTVSEMSVRPVIGGCALLEKHPVYDDGALDSRLLLLRGYDEAADRWRQVVFGYEGGVWEWELASVEGGWRLEPAGGQMAGRLRIFERPDSVGLTKTIEVREDGAWAEARLIRYVPR